MCRAWCEGIKGVGENPCPARVPVLWAGRRGRTTKPFPRGPGGCLAMGSHGTPPLQGWTRGSLRSLGLTEARDNRFSVSGIPDTAGHLRRAENKMGALGEARSAPGPRGGKSRDRVGAGWFPHGRESLVCGWNAGRPSEGHCWDGHLGGEDQLLQGKHRKVLGAPKGALELSPK